MNTIKTITIFANCQGSQLSLIFHALLRGSGIKINFLSNNKRTGEMLAEDQILAQIKESDLLIYHPLAEKHGSLSEEKVLNTIQPDTVHLSFPYIYNSGVYSLILAPKMSKHGYGYIFGEEIIIKLYNEGHSLDSIIKKYKAGEIDFDLKQRFDESLEEMRKREDLTDIKLTDFIRNNYQSQKLFSTHNHPTNMLLFEVLRQILSQVDLPIDSDSIQRIIIPDLFAANCPITPYDIKVHGYQFQPHKDWLEKGSKLIKLIINHYDYETSHTGQKLEMKRTWQERTTRLSRKIRNKLQRIIR